MYFASDYSTTESYLYIGNSAFSGCSSLAAVAIEDRPFDLCYDDDGEVYTVGENFVDIGEYAFADCESLADLYLGQGVSCIYANAFANTAISSVTIPATASYIDSYAFGGCENLEDVYFEGYDILWKAYYIDIADDAFADTPWSRKTWLRLLIDENGVLYGFDGFCYSCPEELEIPEGVVEINSWAFSGMEELKSVKWPSSLRTIGFGAFAKTGLETLDGLGEAVEIGAHAFSGTAFDLARPFEFEIADGVLLGFHGKCPASVTIPEGVTNIADAS